MQEIILSRLDNETLEQCLWRLGSLKKSGKIEITWNHITDFLNDEFDLLHGESAYRKKYKRLARAAAVRELEAIYNGDYAETTKHNLRELEKQRIRIAEEKAEYSKELKAEAQSDAILEELKAAIVKAEPIELQELENVDHPKSIYAMLSDMHYGLTFNSYYDRYNPEIATMRTMQYAEHLVNLGRQNGIHTIYVSILGDMVSGIIHQSIRIANRGNMIEQVVGASELIAAFLLRLAQQFKRVIVTDVAGNHSRIEMNAENALRGERMDRLIPWYCRAKLDAVKNVQFVDNEIDPTISALTIFGKTYVAVHGDFDPDLKTSALKISQLIGKKIDYFMAAHMHVPEFRMEDTMYIRNGAIVSGGDEYTSKKRLFGPAAQVCMIISPEGVESIYPIKL
jgi:hypothetical protein